VNPSKCGLLSHTQILAVAQGVPARAGRVGLEKTAACQQEGAWRGARLRGPHKKVSGAAGSRGGRLGGQPHKGASGVAGSRGVGGGRQGHSAHQACKFEGPPGHEAKLGLWLVIASQRARRRASSAAGWSRCRLHAVLCLTHRPLGTRAMDMTPLCCWAAQRAWWRGGLEGVAQRPAGAHSEVGMRAGEAAADKPAGQRAAVRVHLTDCGHALLAGLPACDLAVWQCIWSCARRRCACNQHIWTCRLKKHLTEQEKVLKEFRCALCKKTLQDPLSTPCSEYAWVCSGVRVSMPVCACLLELGETLKAAVQAVWRAWKRIQR